MWRSEVALPMPHLDGGCVTVLNIPNFHRSETDFALRHYAKAFDPRELVSVGLTAACRMAVHIMGTLLSFVLEGGGCLSIPIETRKETSELYSPARARLLTGGRYAARQMPRAVLIVLLCLGDSLPAAAAEMQQRATSARPKIGLVLGGGGARGSAHVGILKVLEALRVPIDYIAGNSMGAVVGGLYASGMAPDDIERELQAMDWDDVFDDRLSRPYRSFRRKRDDDRYLIGSRLGYSRGRTRLPLAFIQGQKFDLHLNRLTAPVTDIKDFDRLPIPFRAVATDIETGHEVVLASGSLARAIRASMAVPGGFSPVEIGGRLLVDGLVANNLPVNVARDMGADVVIVVDVGDDLRTRGEIRGVIDVVNQLTVILSRRNVEAQLASLGPSDIYIRPELGNLNSGDFKRVTEAIAMGERAGREAAAALSRLSVPVEQYAGYQARHAPQAAPPVIDFIRIENRSRLSDALIRRRVTQKEDQPLDTARLEQDIGYIFGLEIFQSVRYEIVREGEKTGLVIRATEKSWGPDYLQFGLELADDFRGDSSYDLAVSYLRTAINPLNGEIRFGVQIGENPGALIEWHQPLDPLSRYFTSVRLSTGRQNFSRFNDNGDVIADYRVWRGGVDVAAGREFGTWGEGRLGYRRYTGEAEVRIGDPEFGDYEFDLGQLYLRLSKDTFDNSYFPRTGTRSVAEYVATREGYGSDNDFDQLRLGYAHAFPLDRDRLLTLARYETTVDGEAPVEGQFRAGGFLRLSGYRPNELNGQHYGQLGIAYYHALTEFRLLPTFAGFSFEYGNVWQDEDDVALENGVFAGSIFLGIRSLLGPFYMGLGAAEGDRNSVFLYLGPTF